MSAINPEAGTPTSTLAFEQSERNPAVTKLSVESSGGQIAAPSNSASHITQAGPAVSPNAGLKDYGTADSVDNVQDEAEREG
jgi:hypothetical protein